MRLNQILILVAASVANVIGHREPIHDVAPVVSAAPRDEIEAQMGTIKKTLEELTKTIEDASQKAAVLEGFVRLENAFMACKTAIPERAAKVAEGERDTFVSEYRRYCIDVIKMCLDAEKKFLEGKVKDAKKIIRDVEAAKGKGHGKYKQ